MKNITLSADAGLLEAARRRAERAMATIRELRTTINTGGRTFTRDEMNER